MNRFYQLFAVTLLVKLLLALYVPLTLDEFYYFIWGKYPSLSYFDHPPVTGWLMILSQPLKLLHEGAIRWPFIIMSHGTLLVWNQILKGRLSDQRRFQFLLVGLLNPLWGWGVFIATPDIPLVFFWSLSLLFCRQILSRDHWGDYLGLGASLGLGFLSKYHVALFLPSLLIMLWQQKELKKLLSIKTFASIVLALILCSPVFIWNYLNEWASIEFQWNHGMNFKYWKWGIPFEYVFGQIMIIFPTFLLFLFGKNKAWKKDWLFPFVAFPFAFFLYSSFKGRVEANWVIMSIPAVFALSAIYTQDRLWKFGLKTLYVWGLLFLMALGVIFFNESLPVEKLKLFETRKYQDVLPLIDPDKKYYSYNYQVGAFVSFKTGKLVCKFPGYGRPDHFHFMKECQDYLNDFTYITPIKKYRRQFSDKMPGLKRGSEIPVNDHFRFVEVHAE